MELLKPVKHSVAASSFGGFNTYLILGVSMKVSAE